MELQVKTEITGQVAVVSVKGEIDMYNATGLKEKVVSIIEDSQPKRLILDLQEIDYIDSTGLGILIGFRRRMSEGGGDIRVVIRSKRMERLFEVTGLTKVFGVYKDMKSAAADAS